MKKKQYPVYQNGVLQSGEMEITNETMAIEAQKHIDNLTIEYKRIGKELAQYTEALFVWKCKNDTL